MKRLERQKEVMFLFRVEKLNVDKMKDCVCPPMKEYSKEEEAWRYFDIVNCYSYALGLFVDISFLRPGEISSMEFKSQYSDSDIIERFFRDAEMLGLEVRESNLDEILEDEDAWKVAILNTGIRNLQEFYDYHFLKQGVNKMWYHKHPYEQFPTRYDTRNRIIDNPETAKYSYDYHLVGYYAVKKRKK